MFKPVKECGVVKSIKSCRHIESSENSNIARVDIFQDVVCKFEQSSFGRVEFAVSRLKRTETGTDTWGKRHVRASPSNILPIVLRLEMSLKWEGSDSDKPGYFKREEMSKSLKFVGKFAWENDRLARWEMRREKVSAHDFRRS